MSNIYCIIDACSYIYLNQFTFIVNEKDASLYDLLKKTNFITLKHSRTIADEIKRNVKITMKEALSIDNHVYKFQRGHLDRYDKSLFNNTINMSGNDKGEKENIAVAIDLFLNRKYSIIYLSDDKKATGETGHLKEIMLAFPYYQIWSSFEVVLFLYFNFNKQYFDYSRALDSLRDLVAFVFNAKRLDLIKKKKGGVITNDEYSREIQLVNTKAQKCLLSYTERIDIIRNLIAA